MHLTNQQIRHFRDCGYLRLPQALEPETIELAAGIVRRAASREPSPPAQAGTERKFYRLYERDTELMLRLIRTPGLVEPLQDLLGPNVVYLLNRHNQASINAPGQTLPRLHRDILQWTRGLVTAVLYLEDATVENGCTHVIPASHYLPSMGVPQPDGGGTWMDEHQELADMMDQAVPVPMAAGDVLLFDALLFHSVGANNGSSSRASIVLGFRSADELDAQPDTDRQVLVSGVLSYRGNDRAAA